MRRPKLLIFDVNETLSDLAPLADRFVEVGAPAHLATPWFAAVLRDGFALTTVGVNEKFATVAGENLRVALGPHALDRDLESAVQHVIQGISDLPTHPDVPDGLRALAKAGYRMVTLGNGSTAVADAVLERAGARDCFEALLSVEDAPSWKPSAEVYAYALRRCEVDPSDAMLIAVHPWDVDGAARAGLATAWVDRNSGAHYPSYFEAPDLTVRSMTDLAAALVA